MKKRILFLCLLAGSATISKAAPVPCPDLPALLTERLLHLHAAYPEWRLEDGTYCLQRSGDAGYWTYADPATDDTLFSPSFAWRGELSSGLAQALRGLAQAQNERRSERRHPGAWLLGAATGITLATLFWLDGRAHTHQSREVRP